MFKISIGLLVCALLRVSAEAENFAYPDTETLANRSFDASIVRLIRTAIEEPKAKIEVETRSPWYIDYFEKQSTRWWQVIFFHFSFYVPLIKHDLSGFALTIFVYDPAKSGGEIMTPEDAALAIQRGRELNSIPSPSARPALLEDGSI